MHLDTLQYVLSMAYNVLCNFFCKFTVYLITTILSIISCSDKFSQTSFTKIYITNLYRTTDHNDKILRPRIEQCIFPYKIHKIGKHSICYSILTRLIIWKISGCFVGKNFIFKFPLLNDKYRDSPNDSW